MLGSIITYISVSKANAGYGSECELTKNTIEVYFLALLEKTIMSQSGSSVPYCVQLILGLIIPWLSLSFHLIPALSL